MLPHIQETHIDSRPKLSTDGRFNGGVARFQLLEQELQDRAYNISCSEQVGMPRGRI